MKKSVGKYFLIVAGVVVGLVILGGIIFSLLGEGVLLGPLIDGKLGVNGMGSLEKGSVGGSGEENYAVSGYIDLLENPRVRNAIESNSNIILGDYDTLLLSKVADLETGNTDSWNTHRQSDPWTQEELREVFLQKVALSLYVEVNNLVPWSFLDYSDEDLELLLGDSFYTYWFPFYLMYNNNPLIPFGYANEMSELYPSSLIVTGKDLLYLIVVRMRDEGWKHVSASENISELCMDEGLWGGNFDFTCTEAVRRGTSGLTPSFISSILQTYNIPTKQVDFSGHGGMIFPTLNLSMDGDAVYNSLKAGITLRPNVLPVEITFYDLDIFKIWEQEPHCEWASQTFRKDVMEYLHLYCDSEWNHDIIATYNYVSPVIYPNKGDKLRDLFQSPPFFCQIEDPSNENYYTDTLIEEEIDFWFDLIGNLGVELCPDWNECYDGIDNDRDGLVDWPFDPACQNMEDTSEIGSCGDSLVETVEECDDGNFIDGDGCDNFCRIEEDWRCIGEPSICTYGSVRVFIEFAGSANLGGVRGADQICQQAADNAGLNSTFQAWISNSTTSVSQRFVHHEKSYTLLDGTLLAINWNDLTDGVLSDKITQRANGEYIEWAQVWTGTEGDGTQSISNCIDWTTGSNDKFGRVGHTNSDSNGGWTSWGNISCNGFGRWLYCFEYFPLSVCGNSILESGEQCDPPGSSQSCNLPGSPEGGLGDGSQPINYMERLAVNGTGTQTCSASCTWGSCVSNPVCGDNVCNGDENCSSCLGDCGSCGGGGGSFLPGTEITMGDESKKKIEEVKIGDGVLSYDENRKRNVISRVSGVFNHVMLGYYVLDNELKITATNPIFVNGKWGYPPELKVGDELLTAEGKEKKIRSIKYVGGEVKVYNLQIEKTGNYFAEGILVHNKNVPPWAL